MTESILILNGPNLNLLGKREPAVYGDQTLDDLRQACLDWARALDLTADFRQTNDEGRLVDWIQEGGAAGKIIILNAAAYTHTSVALRDAIIGSEATVIEVHISNIHAREAFRHVSHISPVACGLICGFGIDGYRLALEAAHGLANRTK
ncbi:MAG: type II 3-dehydroquinate dehydratase [Magnetovibrionaceae bacterium]